MKTSTVCTGMLSSENDDFKFLKTAKHIKSTCITYIIVQGLVKLFLSLQTSPSLTKIMNEKVAIELYCIFSKISKIRYWLLFTDAECSWLCHVSVSAGCIQKRLLICIQSLELKTRNLVIVNGEHINQLK